MSHSHPLKVVFIAAHDAYQKGARNICALLEKQARIQVSWLTTSRWLVPQGLCWLDLDRVARNETLQQADLIFAGLGGRDLNRLICGLREPECVSRTGESRPRIIGYFPGVLHLRIFESLATRLLCDQVLLNCERDYRLYRQLALATIGDDNGVLFGAPWVGAAPGLDQPCDIDLLFVEQSVVPETLHDRTLLVERLAGVAARHPGWRIVVVLRARKGEASSHQVEYCLEEIGQQLGGRAATLEFVVDDIDSLTARARRVATLSSSVAYTSLAWGKPTLFINDLGVEPRWGNDLFKQSGYMASLEAIDTREFSVSRWGQQFIQLPDPGALTELCQRVPVSVQHDAIPGVRANNLRLHWLLLGFCLQHLKNPLSEFHGLSRTIRNINSRIHNASKRQHVSR